MRYLSVCSGIEAASAAWEPLGWHPVGFAEVDPFCSALLAQRFPNVTNYGDLNGFEKWEIEPFDVLIGGTPCQSFSLAGKRAGLDDPRGDLAMVFLGLARRTRPRWIVWENVPGVLSSGGGRDFGALLGTLVDIGYGFAYRVLDAQYFGVPQRRRRVFVVGHLGDATRATQVLFEPQGSRGDLAKGGASGQVAATVARASAQDRGRDEVTHTITPRVRLSHEEPLVACSQVSPPLLNSYGKGRTHRLHGACVDTMLSLVTNTIASGSAVRRLTPRECERLQGFHDDWTLITYRGKPALDGPRYAAIGNSMAVPVIRWIGKRIEQADRSR